MRANYAICNSRGEIFKHGICSWGQLMHQVRFNRGEQLIVEESPKNPKRDSYRPPRPPLGIPHITCSFPPDQKKHYVRNGEVVDRPKMKKVRVDGRRITFPKAARCRIRGGEADRKKGEADIPENFKGRATLEIECWPFQNERIRVDCRDK